MPDKIRCVECGEFHQGECDPDARIAFAVDCSLDMLDKFLGEPMEPGSRRWMIARGEYPPGAYPAKLEEHLKIHVLDLGRGSIAKYFAERES